MIERLAEDHANARRLAEGLAELDGIVSAGGIAQPAPGRLDPDRVRTNFVLFKVARRPRRVPRGAPRAERPDGRNIPTDRSARSPTTAINATDIDTILAAVAAVLRETAPTAAGAH